LNELRVLLNERAKTRPPGPAVAAGQDS